jgi:hypothetical protein
MAIKEKETKIELNMYNISERALSCRHKFIQHLLIMYDTHIPKLVCEDIPNGIRNVGRPKRRWRDQEL